MTTVLNSTQDQPETSLSLDNYISVVTYKPAQAPQVRTREEIYDKVYSSLSAEQAQQYGLIVEGVSLRLEDYDMSTSLLKYTFDSDHEKALLSNLSDETIETFEGLLSYTLHRSGFPVQGFHLFYCPGCSNLEIGLLFISEEKVMEKIRSRRSFGMDTMGMGISIDSLIGSLIEDLRVASDQD